MKLTVVLAVLIGTLVLACSTVTPVPAEPTPNIDATAVVEPTLDIDATVEARLAHERAVDATVEARLKEERASQATSIPNPTNTQAPIPTYTPNPTYTPYPTPTNTPTLVPTATSVPTPTPSPILTRTPRPTPAATQQTRGIITISPASGLPGAQTIIVGTGFTPNSFIQAGSNDCLVSGITMAGKCESGSHLRTTVSSAGEFVLSYTVPMNSVSNASGTLLELKVTDSGGTVGSCPCFNLIVAEPTPPTPTPRPTATPQPSRATYFGDGTWVVGSDIKAGTYRSSQTGSSCYWQRLSGFSGEFDDIIVNELTEAISVVEISSTDAGFSTERCGTWTEATSSITSSLSSPFGDGAYVVGLDIGSGTWTSPGGDSCYWARLSGFSGDLKHIEANSLGGSNNILTIKSTDNGFESSNCGTWTKTG